MGAAVLVAGFVLCAGWAADSSAGPGLALWILFRTGSHAAPGRPGQGLAFWLCVAGVGAGFVVFLVAGFRLSGDPAPAGLENAFWPALAILIFCLAAAAWAAAGRLRGLAGLARAEARAERQQAGWRALQARRVAALAADPARAPYAERIRRGEVWSDEQIDYDLDPDRVATCVHLQPIERAMRAAGVAVKPYMAGFVQARCRVDVAALEARWAPPTCVRYREFFTSERAGAPDLPLAQLACAEHASAITTTHPLDATVDTPAFPPRPGP